MVCCNQNKFHKTAIKNMSLKANDIINETIAEIIEEDIYRAQKENYETNRELSSLGYLPSVCTVCLDPVCNGEYSHNES